MMHCEPKWKLMEMGGAEGDTPVHARRAAQRGYLSRAGHVEPCPNPRGPSRKAEYDRKTDSEPVP